MPFTQEAPKFLFENHARNDREWFKANKNIYEKEIVQPFAEMITHLTPLMNEIDEQIICSPKKISRIYRDARFVKGGSIFRESIWCSLMRKKEPYVSKPEFFFWISPDNFGWGCGYYQMPSPVMEKLRELIIKNDETSKAALKAYKNQNSLILGGEMYKRDHFPEQPDDLKEWLNRKNLHLTKECNDAELFFSDKLCETVAEDFRRAAPVYKLFIKAEELVVKEH